MKNYITGKSNIRTNTEKYLRRLLIGMAVVSVAIFSIGFVLLCVYALFGVYLDEPTFVGVILLFIVMSYIVGVYFDNNEV
jgi:hypothetical protein